MSHKKVIFKAILNLLFTETGLFTDLYPTQCITFFFKSTKNPLNFYLLKVNKFHGDSVKNESARATKIGAGQTPPPAQPV